MPDPATAPQSKGEIALCELDRLRAEGLRFGTVLADAGYGVGAAFRHGLNARGLRWAVGIVKNQKVCASDVRLVPPTGRARKPVPDGLASSRVDDLYRLRRPAAPPPRRASSDGAGEK